MRLILALTLIAVAELTIRVIDYSMEPAPTTATLTPLKELPNTLGSWTGADAELDHHIFRNSGASDMVNRIYQNPLGDRVAVNLGLWLDYDPVMPHKPEICYPSAGWEIENRKIVKINAPGGRSFKARLLSLQSHEQRIALLYWVALDSEVALDDGDVRQVLQQHRGFGKTRPPAIKVMLQSDAQDAAAAEQRVIDLAELIVPQLDNFTRQTK